MFTDAFFCTGTSEAHYRYGAVFFPAVRDRLSLPPFIVHLPRTVVGAHPSPPLCLSAIPTSISFPSSLRLTPHDHSLLETAQRAYRRRLLRLGPKRNGKKILIAGGKAAAAVFSSVLSGGGGSGGGSTNHLMRLNGTARTTVLGLSGVARLTGTARATVTGLGLNGVARTTLVLKTVSSPWDCPRKRA